MSLGPTVTAKGGSETEHWLTSPKPREVYRPPTIYSCFLGPRRPCLSLAEPLIPTTYTAPSKAPFLVATGPLCSLFTRIWSPVGRSEVRKQEGVSCHQMLEQPWGHVELEQPAICRLQPRILEWVPLWYLWDLPSRQLGPPYSCLLSGWSERLRHPLRPRPG